MKKILIELLLISTTLIAKDYALIVGISKYKNSEIPRLNIKNDITRYENILKKMGFHGSRWYLKNSKATKTRILRDIKNISQVIKKDDRFFMFFTGYGTSYMDEDYGAKLQMALPKKYWLNTSMILPYDFNSNKKKIAETLIIVKRDLQDFFTEIDNKTDKVLIVFDAPFSYIFPDISKRKSKQTYRFVHLNTRNEAYPYKNIVYIGASKTQAKVGKLSNVLNDCMDTDVSFLGLKSCMNEGLKKSPHRAIVLSRSDEPKVFERKHYISSNLVKK